MFDEHRFTTLYLGIGEELKALEGQFSVTDAPSGRDRDHHDFAFHALAKHLVDKVRGHFVGLDEISKSGRSEQGRYYTALGYPNSKNQKYDPERKSVKARLFSYSNLHKIDVDIAAKLPDNGAHHIFMRYDKRSRDEDGEVVNSTKPNGMSGGAVVDAGCPADMNVFSRGEMPEPLLAGIVIELKNKVLLAVRMEIILPALLAALPEIEGS